LIIYAGGAERTDVHEIQAGGKRIEIRVLDMTQNPPELLAQVARLANRVLELAAYGQRTPEWAAVV
jgi:gamma-glutamyl:cysteine ligase YbdK (ATP-grasp superfamily)